jgi:hypothetical protein
MKPEHNFQYTFTHFMLYNRLQKREKQIFFDETKSLKFNNIFYKYDRPMKLYADKFLKNKNLGKKFLINYISYHGS